MRLIDLLIQMRNELVEVRVKLEQWRKRLSPYHKEAIRFEMMNIDTYLTRAAEAVEGIIELVNGLERRFAALDSQVADHHG